MTAPGLRARNFAGAIAVALVLAWPMFVPTILGIDTWKIVLGLAGFALFVAGGVAGKS